METELVQTDIEQVLSEIQQEEKRTRQPFDFKIKALKQYLKAGGMDKHKINKTVKLYKERVYAKVAEVKAKMEKELEEKLNASNK